MLSVELPCTLRCEASHLKFAYHETALVDLINDFTGCSIGVWLNHSEGPLSFALKLLPSEQITILNKLELS